MKHGLRHAKRLHYLLLDHVLIFVHALDRAGVSDDPEYFN